MPEYAIFASWTVTTFSDLFWEMRNLWKDIPWDMEVVIALLVVFLVFMFLRTRK